MVEGKKLGLVGRVLLVGGVLVSGGCMTEEDMVSWSLRSASQYSKTPEGAVSAMALADTIDRAQDRETTLQAAREGKTEVNVNVGTSQPVDKYRNKRVEIHYRLSDGRLSVVKGIYIEEHPGFITIKQNGEIVNYSLKNAEIIAIHNE